MYPPHQSSHSTYIILIFLSRELHSPSLESFLGCGLGHRDAAPLRNPPGICVPSLLPAKIESNRQPSPVPGPGSHKAEPPSRAEEQLFHRHTYRAHNRQQCRGVLYTQELPPYLPSCGQEDFLRFYRLSRWHIGAVKQRNPNFHTIGLIFFSRRKKNKVTRFF